MELSAINQTINQTINILKNVTISPWETRNKGHFEIAISIPHDLLPREVGDTDQQALGRLATRFFQEIGFQGSSKLALGAKEKYHQLIINCTSSEINQILDKIMPPLIAKQESVSLGKGKG